MWKVSRPALVDLSNLLGLRSAIELQSVNGEEDKSKIAPIGTAGDASMTNLVKRRGRRDEDESW